MFSTFTHAVTSAYARIPGFLGDHVTLSSFLTIAAGIGILAYARKLWRDGAPDEVADADDAEDHLRALRIEAENRERADWGWTGPLPVAAVAAVLDARTAELVIDPTLKPADVPTIIEHMAHGAGSLADAAAVEAGTHLRTPSEESAFQTAWDAALLEAPAREAEIEDRRFFAVFRLRMDRAAEAFEAMPGVSRAEQWLAYAHDAGEVECPCCAAAVAEISGEYEALVERVMAEGTRELVLVGSGGRTLASTT